MFRIVKKLDGSSSQMIHTFALTDGEAVVKGEALVLTNGKLTKCSATATPQYISARAQSASTPGKTLSVYRVREDDEFEATASVTVAPTLVGAKVTIAADGERVTATTTSGVFELTYTDGVTNGGKVRGFFK